MANFLDMLQLQLVLFFIMAAGIITSKLKILTKESRSALSNLLIDLILPCNIITSFDIELTDELLSASGLVLLFSFGTQLLYFLYSKVFFRTASSDKRIVMQYATICSNAGFLGLPIIGGIYGSQGILYASIALIPLRIFMWSAGLSLFTKTNSKTVLKTLLTHPCIIAVFIGFGILFFPGELPMFVTKTLNVVGNCTTTVSMLVIGGILSEIHPGDMLDKRIYQYCFIRLLFIPASILLLLRLLGADSLIISVIVLMAAMPAGSTTAILAAKYNKNALFASQIIFASTLLSLITLPLICLFL